MNYKTFLCYTFKKQRCNRCNKSAVLHLVTHLKAKGVTDKNL
nr:MAG TPA: hypothetical protein [Caudoviricetes sp.]